MIHDIGKLLILRLLDEKIPMRERNWGCTHYVNEKVGEMKFELPPGVDPKSLGGLSFLSPEDYGFDMDRFRSPNVATAVCGPMCHFLRETDDGMELRSRFWLGYKIIDKNPEIDQSSPMMSMFNMEMRGFIAKNLALHCTKEFTHLAKILPMVYADEGVKIE